MCGVNMGAAVLSIIDMHKKQEVLLRVFGDQRSSGWLPQVVELPISFNAR